MTPIRYTAKVLPDGHLPLPEGYALKVGDPVDVTLAAIAGETDDDVARRQREAGRKVAGSLATGTTDGGTNHDKYIYGKPRA